MTALSEYRRLEATALWRDRAQSQRREVLVSLGEATLVISTISDTALSHWSLPAIVRVNPGRRPAIFAPARDADETLEISEAAMIEAIEKIRGAVAAAQPHPGRLRFGLVLAAAMVLIGLAITWLPGALLRQTVAMLPEATERALGRDILAEMARLSGRACTGPAGIQALETLSRRVTSDPPEIVVLPSLMAEIVTLPGGLVAIDRGLVENHERPEVLAGHLLAEAERTHEIDPTRAVLAQAGFVPTLRLLTTGRLPDRTVHAVARDHLVSGRPAVDDLALLARFESRSVSSEPYAYALDISGETTLTLIEADPLRGQSPAALITARDWAALQNICAP